MDAGLLYQWKKLSTSKVRMIFYVIRRGSLIDQQQDLDQGQADDEPPPELVSTATLINDTKGAPKAAYLDFYRRLVRR
jgi:hypothetical protein